MSPLLNGAQGIRLALGSSHNIIGGTTAAARNVISGNFDEGIMFRDAGTSFNVVIGNYIGVDITGSGTVASIGNQDDGVQIEKGASYNRIGGTTAAERNIISNNEDGIVIADAGTEYNVIQGNYIGTDASGALDRGNTIRGIQLYDGASNNTIGGTATGAGNLIAHNVNDGVRLGATAGTGNAILGNSIYDNSQGIDLGINGVTPNRLVKNRPYTRFSSGWGDSPMVAWVGWASSCSSSMCPVESDMGSSGCGGFDISHPYQIVSSHGEQHLESNPRHASELGLTYRSDGLSPAEDLLDAFAYDLADLVAGMAGGSRVDGRAALACDVLCHVGNDPQRTKVGHETLRVIGLVLPKGESRTRDAGQHLDSRLTLAPASSLGHYRVDHQTVTVLHQYMPGVTKLRRVSVALAVHPCLRISGRFVGVVLTRLTTEVTPRVAPRSVGVIVVRPVLTSKAALRRPGLNQRPIDAEVLIGNQPLRLRLGHHMGEELARDIPLEQPVTVLREGRTLPYRIIGRKPYEPPIQQVVIELLNEQSLTAYRVKHLQQERTKQSLWSDRRPPLRGVETPEIPRHRHQRLIDHRAHRAQRMVRRHSRFQRNVAEQTVLSFISTAHPILRGFANRYTQRSDRSLSRKFRVFHQPANDLGTGDADSGPNELQNFPDLTNAYTNGTQILIQGVLDSTFSSTFRIEFFATAAPSSGGEGEVYLGFANVTTNGAGVVTISETFTASVAAGAIITATATDAAGNTSEFGTIVAATAANDVLVVDTTSFVVDGNVSTIAALLLDKGGDGRISLSEAVQAANNSPNIGLPDLITFNIPLDDLGHVYYQDDGGAPGWNSTPVATTLDDASITDFDTDLPGTPRSWYRIQYTGDIDPVNGDIADPVYIDATTQPGFSGEPIIELDFSLPGAALVDGLRLRSNSDGSTIRGFIFNGMQSEDPIKIDSSDNKVVGNWFGLDSTGTVAIGNADNGIHLSSSNNNIIGGSTAADRNVFAGNANENIRISKSSNNIILGNYIGTDKTGQTAIGTSNIGILVSGDPGSANNIIGGTNPGEANIIVGHTSEGILLEGVLSTTGNTISGNSIYSNGVIGIAVNDGTNDAQSTPTLTSAVSDGITTTVVGSLSSFTANKTFTLEFFASASTSPGEEGETYMGSTVVTTDNLGTANFTAALSVGVTNGAIITATATNDAGSTSQFGGTVAATGPLSDNAPVANDDAYTVAQDTTLTVDWWDTAWTKRQKLTFDNLRQTEDLADFPVLVELTGGFNIDYTQTKNQGEDLRFFDADGTALAYEIEEWNENGTSYVWVRVPKIDGWSNTDHIWMYYGNGTAIAGQSAQDVWMPSYQGVWHLSESGTGAVDDFKDSTAFANHGQGGDGTSDPTITPTQDTGGKIGNAQMFDGNDYIEIANNFSMPNVSMELWFYYDGVPSSSERILAGKSAGGSPSWLFHVNAGTDQVRIRDSISGNNPKYLTSIGTTDWHHVVATMEGLENKLYLDGTLVGSGLSSPDDWTSFIGNFFIGQRGNDTMFWDNLIDEVRVSDVSRTADWVAAQYASMSGTFVSFSGMQSAPVLSGVIANDTDDDDDPLNAILIDGPSKAAAFTFNADGTFSYTPATGYTGSDSFTYRVNDAVGGGDSNIATVTINVDGTQDVTFALSRDVASVSEEAGGTVTFTITLSQAINLGNSVSIDITDVALGAETSSDTTATLQVAIDAALPAGVTRLGDTLTFADTFVGTTFGFGLTALDDALVEGTEALALQLTNATNANGTTGITTATASTDITEIDQDVTFALSRDVASVSEEAGGTVTFTITLSQAINLGNSVSIDITDVALGAETSSDTTATLQAAIDAVLPVGVTRVGNTLTFDDTFVGTTFGFGPTALDDALVEGTEALALQLTNATNANGTTGITTAIASTDITEIDQDVTFALTRDVASVSEEGGGTATFTITLSQAINAGNSVSIDITDVAGAAETSSDTTATLQAAIDAALPAGVTRLGNTLTFDDTFVGTTFGFGLTAQDDALVEGTEALALQLTNATNANGTTGITTATASTDITEIDQDVTFALSRDVASVSEEGGGTVTFTITLSQAVNAGNSVSIDITDVAGAGETSSDTTLALQAAIDAALPAGVTRLGDTLTFDNTFVGTTFGFGLTAVDDALVEGTEALALQLSNATNANGTTGITTATASTDITEIDQDVTFALSRDVASVSEEGGGTVTFTITLSQAINAGNSVSIDITDVAGAAETSSDTTLALQAAIYAALPAGVTRLGNTLTFDDTFVGTTFGFGLTAVDDALVEGTEALALQLTNATNANGTTGITTATASTDITEIDQDVTFALNRDVASISEDSGGTVTFTITLSQAINAGNSVSIDITDVAGAAETSSDTTLALQAAIDAALPAGVTRLGDTLTFDDTFVGTTFGFGLTALDDALVEGTEALALQLTNATNANGTTGITTATASTDITEIDQDVTFALTRDVASISEEAGGTVTFTITLSQAVGAGNSVSIDITDVAGAAETSSDTTATLQAAIDAALPVGVTRLGDTLTFDDTFVGTTFGFGLTAQDDAAI